MRELRATFYKLRAAYLAHSPAEFNEASHEVPGHWSAKWGRSSGLIPARRMIDLEVAYNHWAPFRFAWVLMLVACLCVLLQMGSGWKVLYPLGLASYAAGMAAMLVGFFMRVTISGRAPVTNMYESVVYVGLGVAAIGLILELIYRKRFIAVAAAAVATVALILADNCPSVLDSSLQPLQPVLRNNFWLVTHVMTITLSYAAFALAMGIANITLGYYLVRSENRPAIEALSRFTYRALQVGVVLLATGTFLGGMWAAYSWGRFWGWDPKEVWALIALLGYLAVLHSRFAGWVKHRGLAALAVSCFALVIVAWYGVNFVLGAGLHSYGFGGGGKAVHGLARSASQALYVARGPVAFAQAGRHGQAAPAACRHARRGRGRNEGDYRGGVNVACLIDTTNRQETPSEGRGRPIDIWSGRLKRSRSAPWIALQDPESEKPRNFKTCPSPFDFRKFSMSRTAPPRWGRWWRLRSEPEFHRYGSRTTSLRASLHQPCAILS